jgi:pectinesterase
VLSIFLLCTGKVISQIPRDTSYTVASTHAKLVKQYPGIKPAYVTDSASIRKIPDVVYSIIQNTPFAIRELHADIFMPRHAGNLFPAILMIHGGGWRSGDKSLNTSMAQALVTKGFVVVSVEYRLSLEAKYPAAVHDVVTAVNWIRANAKEFQIDTGKIAVGGYSAGGQLASLIGVMNGKEKFTGFIGDNVLPEVNAVINLDGLCDFTDPESLGLKRTPNSADVSWFEGTYETNPKRWTEASPLTWVDRDAPPFLFIYSSQTRFHAGCTSMSERLNQYGVYNEIHKLEDAPHSYWFFHPWFDPMIDYITDFLNKVFYKK